MVVINSSVDCLNGTKDRLIQNQNYLRANTLPSAVRIITFRI